MDICDQITFEQLLQPMEALLLNVIYNKVKNAEMAKEIYHNAIVSGMSNFNKLRDKQKFPAWMFSITKNEIRLYFRKEKRRCDTEITMDMQDPMNTPTLHHHSQSIKSVENIVLCKNEKQRLEEAIAALEEIDRIVIYMAYYQAMPLSEIASVLDVSLASIKMRKRRALDKLKEMLDK